jgi:hypothetical protein
MSEVVYQEDGPLPPLCKSLAQANQEVHDSVAHPVDVLVQLPVLPTPPHANQCRCHNYIAQYITLNPKA